MPAVIDDGWRPSFLSRCLEWLFGSARSAISVQPITLSRDIESPPVEEEATEPLAVVGVVLPPDVSVSSDAAEQFLLSLAPCWSPVSFEIIGQPDRITMQVACQASDRHHVWPQLRAHFPDAVCTETADPLGASWTDGGLAAAVVDFGLSQEFMRPLRSVRRLDPDPLTGIVGALDDLEPREKGVVQVIFLPARGPWTQSVLRSLTTRDGKPFFADAPEMLALAREKVARPLFGAVVRVAGQSPDHERAWDIVRHIGGALTVACANPTSNELIALTNDDYSEEEHLDDLVSRRTHRSGMLLNSAELLTLVHPRKRWPDLVARPDVHPRVTLVAR